MLINLGLGLFALTLASGALASADLTPLAQDLAAFLFVTCGAASILLIAADVILAFIASRRDEEAPPPARLAHRH